MGGGAPWAPTGSCEALGAAVPPSLDLVLLNLLKRWVGPQRGRLQLGEAGTRGAYFPEPGREGTTEPLTKPGAFDGSAQRAGWVPIVAIPALGVSHLQAPGPRHLPSPAAGFRGPRGAERAQPAPRSAFREYGEGRRGVVFLLCRLALSSTITQPEDAKGSLFNSPPTTAVRVTTPFTPRNSAFPGAQERRSLCSADKDLDAHLPGQSRRSGPCTLQISRAAGLGTPPRIPTMFVWGPKLFP